MTRELLISASQFLESRVGHSSILRFVLHESRNNHCCEEVKGLKLQGATAGDALESYNMSEDNEITETTKENNEYQNNALAERIAREFRSMSPLSCSIYVVPAKLRELGKDKYEPSIISVGPYHHGNTNLEASQKYKSWYLDSYLTHSPDRSLKDCVAAIREMEEEARECYAHEIGLSSDDFVRMMVLDGCFILELFRKYHFQGCNMEWKDFLFDATWIVPSLRRDLILLENQIPFRILDRLYQLSDSHTQDLPLGELAVDFFDPILPTVLRNQKYSTEAKHLHLLDLLRTYLIHPFDARDFAMEFGNNPYWEFTNCATDLRDAGVKFKRKDSAKSLLDITFSSDGTLEIPPFFFGTSWAVLISNLIALEQCHRDHSDTITSYVFLLHKLINCDKEVKLLCDKGILQSLSMKDERVAVLVDNVCQEVVINVFFYDGLCSRINAYCRTPWRKWRAYLMRNHFNNPWSVFSLASAILLLVLTVLQTIYALSY